MHNTFLEEIGRLGGTEVFDAQAAARDFGADTGASQIGFGGAIRVLDAAAIRLIVLAANRHRQALWPVSGGRNFGYGTARPAVEGTILLDLSALRAVTINVENATAEIQPGVTQADLEQAIAASGADLLVPTTGVGPNGNLLGNALDGGYGLTPVADHFSALAALDGFWGDGSPFRHVYADMDCADMAERWSCGTGPAWGGLLRQGNLGIVTRATLQLARVPEAVRILVLEWPSSAAFQADQAALSRLVEEIPGIGGVIAMNDYRILSTQADAPLASEARGEARMAYLDGQAQQRRIARWTAIATLYGSRAMVAGAARDIRRRLDGCRVWSFTPREVRWLDKLFGVLPQGFLPHIRRHLGSLVNALGTVQGRPIVAFLRIAYALEALPRELGLASDPARDGSGILWYAPLVPLNAASVARYETVMSEVLQRHGFDPLLALTTRSSRVLSATIPILFRRDDAIAAVRAKACYVDLVKAGLAQGWPPYRIGSDTMHLVHPPVDSVTAQLHTRLKLALDPVQVISPGRYTRHQDADAALRALQLDGVTASRSAQRQAVFAPVDSEFPPLDQTPDVDGRLN
ncbi:FAD-binding oxidoreductase [Uliginosibacterium flavum]|uniref:FAD-binding protein n=1 Tax=Uliginosibacterium flavum TaxID=1396831 RepID=A0ABV2TKM1_9RHOO